MGAWPLPGVALNAEMDLVGLDTSKVIQSSIDSYIYNRSSFKPDNINLPDNTDLVINPNIFLDIAESQNNEILVDVQNGSTTSSSSVDVTEDQDAD